MAKEPKVFLIGGLLTVVAVGLGILFLSNQKTEVSITAQVQGLSANPESFDLGEVAINGGLVTKEYELKNTTDKTLRLKKITTSCMCTKAKVIIGDKETKLFGMEGMGDKNAPVNLDLPAQESAKVVAEFDPAAHGPQGVGPIDRSVFLTFSDPVGIRELKFSGVVISK